MRIDRLTKPQRVAAASMLVVALAAFLPWVSLFGIGIRGIEGDGQITLVCAIMGLVLLAVATRSEGTPPIVLRVLAYATAVVVALIGITDMNGAAAIGLYLTLFGGIGWLGALVWDGMERGRAAGGADAPTG